MFELMYYPLVHPPRRTVFESVLYWDRLASLVPGGVALEAYDLGRDLKLLEDEGLYRPTYLEPLMLDDYEAYGRVMRTVGRVLEEGTEVELKIPPRLTAETRLWSGKLPGTVERTLLQEGLIVRDDSVEGALRGNSRVLLATMACFAEEASMLLEGPNHRVVPTTDNVYSHQCTTLPLDENEARVSWMLDVAPLLPVPEESTPLEEVLLFRAAHGEELESCMQGSRQLLATIRSEGVTNPTEIAMEFEQQLVGTVDELRRAGARRFAWDTMRCAWVAVATTAVTAATAASGSGHAVLSAAATVGTGIAVNLATAPGRARDDRFTYLHKLTTSFPDRLPAAWVGARL